MAFIFEEPSRTFGEYLLVPGYSSAECIPSNVSLRTPVVKFKKGEESAVMLNIPHGLGHHAVGFRRQHGHCSGEGRRHVLYLRLPVHRKRGRRWWRGSRTTRPAFVISDSNVTPDDTLQTCLTLKEQNGLLHRGRHRGRHRQRQAAGHRHQPGLPGQPDGPHRKGQGLHDPVREADLLPRQSTTSKEANDIIWEHKLNSLPHRGRKPATCMYLVFRKDYCHPQGKSPTSCWTAHKRYMVGAGINTRDYAERVPALVEAGADVLCIDSSEGFSEWQKRTIDCIREKYGDTVKVGAGNVVDRDGFLLPGRSAELTSSRWASAAAPSASPGRQKGIGRGQATALIEVCQGTGRVFRKDRRLRSHLLRRRHRPRLPHDAGAGHGRGFHHAGPVFRPVRRKPHQQGQRSTAAT